MTHPTDALRLVPIDMQIESILHDLVQEVSAAQRGAQAKRRSRQCCARGAAKNAILNALAPAPASPLPEGGGQLSKNLGQLKLPDLDALEKLADGVIGGWSKSRVLYEPEAVTIKALIAELRETRAALEPFAAHFVIYQADTPPMTVIPLATEYRHIRRAFLARNGKGEG